MSTFLLSKWKLFSALLALAFSTYLSSVAKPLHSPVAGTLTSKKEMPHSNAAFKVSGSSGDTAMILEKCISLALLQPFYPKDSAGKIQPLYVLQHGISFPTDMPAMAASKSLVFIGKSQLAMGEIEAYFLFFTFDILDNAARVEFVFNYNQTGNQKKMQVVSLKFEKHGNTWNMVQSKIEERAS